jgi:hypothetical protein
VSVYVVTDAFGAYQAGNVIADPVAVASVLDSEDAIYVVQIAGVLTEDPTSGHTFLMLPDGSRIDLGITTTPFTGQVQLVFRNGVLGFFSNGSPILLSS